MYQSVLESMTMERKSHNISPYVSTMLDRFGDPATLVMAYRLT